MSEPVQTSQATALEVPVTIQGSQVVPGTDRRELFTETTKTTLTLERGAVVSLKARVTPGQSLFLRNELSGREILCRVLETPAEGKSGYTDLEFTVHDPEFWSVYDKSSKPVEQGPETAEAGEGVGPAIGSAEQERRLPGFSDDPIPPAATSESGASEATHEPASSPEIPETEIDDAKDAERLAGIVARTARRMAQMASGAKATGEDSASVDTPESETTPRRQKAFSTLAFRLHGLRELTVKKNPVVFGVATAVVLAAAAGVAWDVRGMLIPKTPRPAVVASQGKPPQRPSARTSSQAAAATVSKVRTVQPAPKVQPPSAVQVPAARINSAAAATSTDFKGAKDSKPVTASGASDGFTVVAAPPPAPDPVIKVPPQLSVPEVVPARIVSQYQPSLPPWAKQLDLDGIVKLDAVIDANGNVGPMKLISGSRVLESTAEAAVELWIFAPATTDGTPVPSHMILTVEFQR